MFCLYVARLVVRACLFAFALYLFIADPGKLEFSQYFGLAHGINAVDIFFIVLVFDILTKLIPSAPIATGSLKQYATRHMPTRLTFEGGKEALANYLKDMWVLGKTSFKESYDSVAHSAQMLKQLARDGAIDRGHLTADERIRDEIRFDRLRQIWPVIVVWVTLNIGLFAVLFFAGMLNEQVVLVWVMLYFVADLVCVVMWCPFQVLMMKNRCCTTCPIFNWDALMAVTPLLFLPWGGGAFGLPLIVLALIVLIRWELAAANHPERFDQKTNASLSCANCSDKLCRLRPPQPHASRMRRV